MMKKWTVFLIICLAALAMAAPAWAKAGQAMDDTSAPTDLIRTHLPNYPQRANPFVQAQQMRLSGISVTQEEVVAEIQTIVEEYGEEAAYAYAEFMGVPEAQVTEYFIANPITISPTFSTTDYGSMIGGGLTEYTGASPSYPDSPIQIRRPGTTVPTGAPWTQIDTSTWTTDIDLTYYRYRMQR